MRMAMEQDLPFDEWPRPGGIRAVPRMHKAGAFLENGRCVPATAPSRSRL
jgi:hypothetical protein